MCLKTTLDLKIKFSTTDWNTKEEKCSLFSDKFNYFIFTGRVKRKVMSFATLLINFKFLDTTVSRIHVNTPNLKGQIWGPHGVVQGRLASLETLITGTTHFAKKEQVIKSVPLIASYQLFKTL